MAVIIIMQSLVVVSFLAVVQSSDDPVYECSAGDCAGERYKQYCTCDDLCPMYGDCCRDYGATDITRETRHPRIACSRSLDGHYLLVSECPADWTGQFVREMCEAVWPGALAIYLVPVMSPAMRLSYKNTMCALCNGENIEQLEYWANELSCHKSQRPSKSSSFQESVQLAAIWLCRFVITESLRRPCLPAVRECELTGPSRNLTIPNSDQEQQCLHHVAYVGYNGKAANGQPSVHLYRNIHCVTCSGLDITNAKCDLSQFENRNHPLSALTLFKERSISGKSPFFQLEKVNDCNHSSKVFYQGKCSNLKCPIMYTYDSHINVCMPLIRILRYTMLFCSPIGNHTGYYKTSVYRKKTAKCDKGERYHFQLAHSIYDLGSLYYSLRMNIKTAAAKYRVMVIKSYFWPNNDAFKLYVTECSVAHSEVSVSLISDEVMTLVEQLGNNTAGTYPLVKIAVRVNNITARINVTFCSLRVMCHHMAGLYNAVPSVLMAFARTLNTQIENNEICGDLVREYNAVSVAIRNENLERVWSGLVRLGRLTSLCDSLRAKVVILLVAASMTALCI